MKTHAALLLSLASFILLPASATFAAPPAAKIENVNPTSDGQRKIRIIARPGRVVWPKATQSRMVLGRQPVPTESEVDEPALAEDSGDSGVVADAPGRVMPSGRETALSDPDMPSLAPAPHRGGAPGVGQIQVLGMELRYGSTGPAVPVRLDSKLDSDPDFVPRFGGADLEVYDPYNPPECSENSPPTCDGIETIALGSTTGSLVFRARVAYDPDNADQDNDPWTGSDFHREVVSDSTNAIVLIDGDNINDLITQRGVHPPYGNQLPISDVIRPYIDNDGNVYLDENRILILFELGTSNSSSPAWDFQDLVIAVDLDGIVGAPDYVYPNDTAIGEPYNAYPWSKFDWSMIRAVPGGTRIKGLAYQRHTTTVTYDDIRELKACIAATGTNPSWTNCTLRTVYSTTNLGLANATVDMAMNDNGFHGVGWLRYDEANVVRYLVSFTKDNGQNWDVSPHEVGHYTGGSSLVVDDIDLASNEAGSIGVLVYYKLSGSPAPNPVDMYGAVTDSLVLYTYNVSVDPTLNLPPAKTVIVTGSGAQYATNCTGRCFALTGDGDDTFQAFYYEGGVPKVKTITGASTLRGTAVRTITSNSSLSTVAASSTSQAPGGNAGAAVNILNGTGIGVYDVPTSGNIVLRTTTSFSNLIDDSVHSMTLTRTLRSAAPATTVTIARMNSAGVWSSNVISDTLPYPYCGTGGYVGPTCATYGVDNSTPGSVGASVIGNVYNSASFRQEMAWSTVPNPDQYLASVQRIVIHQTSTEP